MKIFNEETGRFMDSGSDEELAHSEPYSHFDDEDRDPCEDLDLQHVSRVGHPNPPGMRARFKINRHLDNYFQSHTDPEHHRPFSFREQINAGVNEFQHRKARQEAEETISE